MERTRRLLAVILLLALAGGALRVQAREQRRRREHARATGAAVAAALGLTDLAIWTEARYTRHPSLADRFSPFQDHPAAIEHFPAGALVPPPPHLVAPGSEP